jgi:ankyrin repeat protein
MTFKNEIQTYIFCGLNMELLYYDVLSCITLKLSQKDNFNFALTSKKYYKLITSNEYCQRLYEIKYGKPRYDKITFGYLHNLKAKKNNLRDNIALFNWSLNNGFNVITKKLIDKIEITAVSSEIKKIRYVECLNIVINYITKETILDIFYHAQSNGYKPICKALISYIDDRKIYDGKLMKYCYSDEIISEVDPSHALYLSCKYNRFKNVKYILKTFTIKVDYRHKKSTYLDYAIIRNNNKMVKFLIKKGIRRISISKLGSGINDIVIRTLLKTKIITPDNINAEIPIDKYKHKTFKYLLDNNLINNKEELLRYAINDCNYYIVILLLEHGTPVGDNLSYALAKKNNIITEYICKYTTNYNENNLYNAIVENNEDMVKYFVTNGVKITSKCLNAACKYGFLWRIDILQFLIDNGADVNGVDENKKSAMEIAIGSLNRDAVKILLKAGYNMSVSEKLQWCLL